MEQESFIIALDLGTSGCRGAAVDARGCIACEHRAALSPVRGEDGTSFYDTEILFNTQEQVLRAVLDEVTPARVAGVAVSSQRSTVVLWSARTGQALAPVLTWEDGRAADEARQAPLSQEEIHALTGLYKTPYFSAPKIAWCLKHIPQVQAALEEGNLCVGPVATYFIWKLTRGKIFATDAALAQRTLLFDINSAKWSLPLCQAFGVPKSVLPEVTPSAGDYGVYTYRGVDIPVVVCTADQQAAAHWTGLGPGELGINYGTGAFLLYHTGDKPVFLPGMLTSVGAGVDAGRSYFLEGPVNAAGSIFMWLNAQGISFSAEEINGLCAQAQHPVRLLPALGGLGAPYWDFTVSPVVENLSPLTRKADWVAGAARGLALLLTDIAAYLQQNGCRVEGTVAATGGLSRVDYLMQFQADLLRRPLAVSEAPDATLLGAAKLAAGYLGWQTDNWHLHPGREFAPQTDAQKAAQEHQSWQAFLHRVRGK